MRGDLGEDATIPATPTDSGGWPPRTSASHYIMQYAARWLCCQPLLGQASFALGALSETKSARPRFCPRWPAR